MSSLKNFTSDIDEEEESDNYYNNTDNDTENNHDNETDSDINNNKNGTSFIFLNHGDSLILKFNYLLLLIFLFI